ncbi:MAG: hypothetical protein LBG46_02885 [Elusimicrobiota bacterium]|jgi:SpoIID/LytB domain protein|nr:hypothetical protein [Elusimicrobiota bacterium]
MRIINFSFKIFLLMLFPFVAQAQSFAELNERKTELPVDSSYQKHADLEKFNLAAGQDNSPQIAQNSTDQESNLLGVVRLPDVKLNENIIRKSVMDYTLNPASSEAAAAYAAGDSALAREKYEDAIISAQDDETSARAAGDIAVISLSAGDYKKALNYINQAAELDKKNPFYQLVKIWILAAQGEIRKAKKEYDKILFLTADFEYLSSAKLALAQGFFLAGKQKDAIEILQNLYSSNPYAISHTAYLMGREVFAGGDYKIAQTFFEQALRHDNNNYTAQKYSAVVQEKLKEFVNAWQTYASIFILNPEDLQIEKKLNEFSKNFKADPRDYLFYVRLNGIINKKPFVSQSIPLRVGLFSQYSDENLAEIESFVFMSSSPFNIKDEKLGKVMSGGAFTPKTVVYDKENQGVHIQNKWNTADFSTKNPFIIDLDKEGYSILIRDVKANNIFAANTGDKELKGSILVIPGQNGMKLINYTNLEDILPSVLLSVTRGVKDPSALEAAAIVMRTRLISKIKNTSFGNFDIADNSRAFRYEGVSMQSEAADNAVKNTKGEILINDGKGGLAAPAIYRSCSAVSEDGIKNTKEKINYGYSPSNVFKFMISNPQKDLISAPQDNTLWASIKWIYSFPAADVESRLKQKYPQIGKLKYIEPAEISPYGRILKMRFTGPKNSVILPFEEANFVLASGTLRSDFFYMIPFSKGGKIKEFLFIGTDTGLGKGLCIDGAAGMARENKTAREILKYYYPNLHISKEWTEQK